MRKKTIRLLLLILITASNTLNAQIDQDLGNIFPQSKDVINQNLFTGTCDINVPFYKYNISGIDINAGITYNTGGLKVDDYATNIGLGWQLNVGGFIVRQERGLLDEEYNGINTGYWSGTTNADGEPDIFYLQYGNQNLRFMFSETGNLLTIPMSNIKIDRYIGTTLVNGSVNSSMAGDLGFIVTDELGNKFYYSKGAYGTSISSWNLTKIVTYEGQVINYIYQAYTTTLAYNFYQTFEGKNNNYGEGSDLVENQTFTNSRVREIQFPNNINVDFTYDSLNARCDLGSDYRLAQVSILERNQPSGVSPLKYTYKLNHAYFLSPTSDVAINSTAYTNGTINSEVSSCSGYENTQLRLKLKSIDLIGYNGNSESYYSFGYSPVPLPQRVWGPRDKYEYSNNGSVYSYTNSNGCHYNLYVPSFSFNSTTIGMDRSISSDESLIEGSVLKSVTNGQGGQILLSYKSVNQVGLDVGGLVLDKLQIYDGYNHDNDLIKAYTYNDGEKFINDGATITWNEIYHDGCSGGGWTTDMASKRLSATNLLNTALNGNRYGFKTVTENVFDHSNNLVKKDIVLFTGLNPGGTYGTNLYSPSFTISDPSFNVPFGTAPYTNKQYLRDWGIGLVTQKFSYNADNRLINKINYTYRITTNYIDNTWNGNSFKSIHKLFYEVPLHYENNSHDFLDFYSTSYTDYGQTAIQDLYYPFTGRTTLYQMEEQDYYDDNDYIDHLFSYNYDANGNLISKQHNNSNGESIVENCYYNYSWIPGSADPGPAINKMNSDGLQRLIYTDKWKTKDTYLDLVNTSIAGFTVVKDNIIRPTYYYDFNQSTLYNLNPYTIYQYPLMDIKDMSANLSVPSFNNYMNVTKFDNNGDPIEQTDNVKSVFNSNVYDHIRLSNLAEAQNAKYSEIAYCGFDSYYDGTLTDFNKGNLAFNSSGITTSHSMLGRCSFHVSTSANHTLLTTTQLTVGKSYTVSYWAYTGSSIGVNDGMNQIPNSTNSSPVLAVATYGSWTLYKTSFVAQATGIGIWGEGYLDDFKLYPSNATMKTSTYLPLIGKVAEVDENDNITTYEYDDFGKLAIKRDQHQNIIEKIKTVTQGL